MKASANSALADWHFFSFDFNKIDKNNMKQYRKKFWKLFYWKWILKWILYSIVYTQDLFVCAGLKTISN